jgi:hypothetical protein
MFDESKTEDMVEAEFGKWADGHEEDMGVVKFDSELELEESDDVSFREDGYIYQSFVIETYNEIEDFQDEDFLDEGEMVALIMVTGRKDTTKQEDDSENVFVL